MGVLTKANVTDTVLTDDVALLGDFNAVTRREDVRPSHRWKRARRWPWLVHHERRGRLVDVARLTGHPPPHTRRRRCEAGHSSYLYRVYVSPTLQRRFPTNAVVPADWPGRALGSDHDPIYVGFGADGFHRCEPRARHTAAEFPRRRTASARCPYATVEQPKRSLQMCMDPRDVSVLHRLQCPSHHP